MSSTDEQHVAGLSASAVNAHSGSNKAQHNMHSTSAMRAMHDSSSSWTERSAAPKAKHTSMGEGAHLESIPTSPESCQGGALEPACHQASASDAATDVPRAASISADHTHATNAALKAVTVGVESISVKTGMC